jgi:hypothetical protein
MILSNLFIISFYTDKSVSRLPANSESSRRATLRTVLLSALAGAAVAAALIASRPALGTRTISALGLNRGVGHVLERLAPRLGDARGRTVDTDGTSDDRSRDASGTATTPFPGLGLTALAFLALLLVCSPTSLPWLLHEHSCKPLGLLFRGRATNSTVAVLTGQVTEL